eukprot:scaffold7186_cov51-Isochrysis_galbana.AAC.1
MLLGCSPAPSQSIPGAPSICGSRGAVAGAPGGAAAMVRVEMPGGAVHWVPLVALDEDETRAQKQAPAPDQTQASAAVPNRAPAAAAARAQAVGGEGGGVRPQWQRVPPPPA